jgi:DNA-binding beta-propeller fold protein YncE
MGWLSRLSALFLVLIAVTFLTDLCDDLSVLFPGRGKLYAGQSGLEGDIDLDLDVDISDLAALASHWLGADCNDPDWCGRADLDHSRAVNMIDFAILARQWPTGADPPILRENNYPTRLALGLDNEVYVSDARARAVFIYDAELNLIGKIERIHKPLGVAVAPDGNIYVGSDADDNVQVYDQSGAKIRTIGAGTIKMPNDLALDRDGRLYVADSLNDKVWIYNSDGSAAGSAGVVGNNPGRLDFPVAITIAYRTEGGAEVGELYVADQKHASIQVFDLQGNFLRAYGGKVTRGMMSWNWQGRFARIQSLAVDAQGRVHAADCYMNKVQILDADTGGYIDSYGEFGTAEGQLNLPLDILISGNKVIVANAENERVEVIYTIP